MSNTKLRIATRGSSLALWQARYVAELLGVEYEEIVITSAGDKDKQSPISEIGGIGVFAKELQNAVAEGRADFAVHIPRACVRLLARAAFAPTARQNRGPVLPMHRVIHRAQAPQRARAGRVRCGRSYPANHPAGHDP